MCVVSEQATSLSSLRHKIEDALTRYSLIVQMPVFNLRRRDRMVSACWLYM